MGIKMVIVEDNGEECSRCYYGNDGLQCERLDECIEDDDLKPNETFIFVEVKE